MNRSLIQGRATVDLLTKSARDSIVQIISTEAKEEAQKARATSRIEQDAADVSSENRKKSIDAVREAEARCTGLKRQHDTLTRRRAKVERTCDEIDIQRDALEAAERSVREEAHRQRKLREGLKAKLGEAEVARAEVEQHSRMMRHLLVRDESLLRESDVESEALRHAIQRMKESRDVTERARIDFVSSMQVRRRHAQQCIQQGQEQHIPRCPTHARR